MLYAQSLQPTALKNIDLTFVTAGRNPVGVYGFGSDEDNYYVYYGRENWYYIVNKKLTTAKKVVVPENKNENFLKIALSGDDVVVFISRYKKSESKGEVVMKTLYKTTGKLKNEKIIATFSMKKSDFFGIATTVSPDNNKTAFLFLLADKKDKADSYYVMVLNDMHNLEWSSVYDLEVSNESFSVKDFTVTNKGELYVAFFSHPENVKKAANKKSYIDLMYLTEETKEKMTLPLEKYEFAEISLKPLKSGDLYLVALFTADDKAYASEFFSMKINGRNFNDAGSQKKEIVEKNTHIKFAANYLIPYNYLYYLEIEKILELDNGNIAVVCEQGISTSYTTQDGTRVYVKVRGSVSTFWVNGNDASVESVSTMEKVQIDRTMMRNNDAKSYGLSIFPFAYGNKVAYLFNDEFKKYSTPAKYKGSSFKNGKDACIVLSTQENGEKAKLDLLSGNKEAGRLFHQILFQEDNRLIVLTQGKTVSFETISLP
jgi:hypothetical protein